VLGCEGRYRRIFLRKIDQDCPGRHVRLIRFEFLLIDEKHDLFGLSFWFVHTGLREAGLSALTLFRSGIRDFWKTFPKNLAFRADIERTGRFSSEMSPALQAALADPNYRDTIKRAILHADTTIRKFIWRGFRPMRSASGQIMVADKTADDFVSEAVFRLINGRRAYDAARSLLDNLNSITDSLVSSAKRTSDRTGIVDWVDVPDEEGHTPDPISTAPAISLAPDETLRLRELREDQKRCVNAIKNSFDGDPKMQGYIDALSARFKRSEISELTEISGAEVDELRRKLVKYARRFFGVSNFKELQQRLQEGT
jgi:hypothetical protein